MRIINKNISELIPYDNNPRFNEDAVETVANSIKEFGFRVPIVIDKENVIVAGHTRLKACKKLGIDIVPCTVVDDLTDEQIRAFRLADNKVAELARWDFELLEEELNRIEEIDMSLFDFEISCDDINLDDFYENDEPKEKEKKLIVCPHCGQPIEI